MNILEIDKKIRDEFSKPLDMMWSVEEFDTFFSFLVDGRHYNFVCEILAHPCVSPDSLQKAFKVWPYDWEDLIIATVNNRNRKVYSDELLSFLVSEFVVKDLLVQHFSDGIVCGSQVDVLWKFLSFSQRYSMLVYSVKAEGKKNLPNYMWVEQYLAGSGEGSGKHKSIFSSRFPSQEDLRLAFADYINSFSEGVDVSGLPLEWLVELAQVQGGVKP